MNKSKRLKLGLGTVSVAAALAAVAAMLVIAAGASAAPPFKQCPAIGADPSCHTLIIVNAKGGFEAENDPSVGPYDGIEDTLIGVQNNSKGTVKTIPIEGTGIFGFDGDGICSGLFSGTPEGCPFGPTGYEGPGTAFEVTEYPNKGNLNFPAGLEAGKSTYFSLELPVSLTCGPEGCKKVEPCLEAAGVGHAGPNGSEGLNENNRVNVSLGGKEELETTIPGGGHFHLTKLTAASCVVIEGGHEFTGSGVGKFNGASGYEVSFVLKVVGKKIYYTIKITKGVETVFEANELLLNGGSKEIIK